MLLVSWSVAARRTRLAERAARVLARGPDWRREERLSDHSALVARLDVRS